MHKAEERRLREAADVAEALAKLEAAGQQDAIRSAASWSHLRSSLTARSSCAHMHRRHDQNGWLSMPHLRWQLIQHSMRGICNASLARIRTMGHVAEATYLADHEADTIGRAAAASRIHALHMTIHAVLLCAMVSAA